MDSEHMFGPRANPERGLLRTIVIAVFVIAVPIALITTTLRVVISEQSVYDIAVQDYGGARVSGIPESELLRANGDLRDYLVKEDAGPLALQVTDNGGHTGPLFSAKEISHMADVRSLVQLMFKVQMISVALVLALAVVMIALWPARVLAAAALWAGVFTAVVLALVGAAAATGFDAAWSQFHQIAFTNNLWQLNPATDHLIQMYPEAFWQDASTAIGMLLLVQALGMVTLTTVYMVFTRNKSDVIEARVRTDQPDRDGHPHRQPLLPPNPRHYIR